MQEASGTAVLGHWQGEARVFLGEWMVSGLLAVLGGPLLFVCPKQAGFEQRCLHIPSLVCPVGKLGFEGSFPTAWKRPLILSPSGPNAGQSSEVLPGQEEATRVSVPAQAVCFP